MLHDIDVRAFGSKDFITQEMTTKKGDKIAPDPG
jgi:hypothetical protein